MSAPPTAPRRIDAGARAALRRATGDVHERLHGVPVLRRLAEGVIARGEYLALLRRLLGFHRAAERRLHAAPALGPLGIDIAERRRSALLAADIMMLEGGAGPAVALAPLPVLSSTAEALGCLYVVEGSTLGGRQLARCLDHILPTAGTEGRLFLLGYGARHAAMWQACCAAIERCGVDAGERHAMVASAVATFDVFEAWFQPP